MKLKMEDERSWLSRNIDLLRNGLILLLIIILICGYIFKKRLPKRLKPRPGIKGTPNKLRVKESSANGRYTKDTMSRLLPYVAEKGEISIAPTNLYGIPKLKIKAAGDNRFYITNIDAFAGRPDIKFNGQEIQPAAVKKKWTAGTNIKISTEERDYNITLNQ